MNPTTTQRDSLALKRLSVRILGLCAGVLLSYLAVSSWKKSEPPAVLSPLTLIDTQDATEAEVPSGSTDLKSLLAWAKKSESESSDSQDKEPREQESQTPSSEPENPAYEIADGDTLSSVFSKMDLDYTDVSAVTEADRSARNLSPIALGARLEVSKDTQGRLNRLTYWRPGDSNVWIYERGSEGRFDVKKEARPTLIQKEFYSGVVENSFYLSALQSGMTPSLIMNVTDVFRWDIDFVGALRTGDRFDVMVEDVYDKLTHKKIDSRLMAARITVRNKPHLAFRMEAPDHTLRGFFNEKAEPLRKRFLRMPLDFGRISSHFGVRVHPLFETVRPHLGTDYAAPMGTPIHATAAGKVIFAGVMRGYGNVMILDHGDHYSTLYAHQKRFASGMHVGTRVTQHQIIGYVGMTGYATGPHVHYEFRIDGKQHNPETTPLPQAKPIEGRERLAFFAQEAAIQGEFDKKVQYADLEFSKVLSGQTRGNP